MRFAYADPPYPGKARKYYADHPDYAGEVDHAALIARLENEFSDGWALSTSADALADVLPFCPPPMRRSAGGGVRRQFRVMSWCKRAGQFGGGGGPLYAWEPVILRGGRRDPEAGPLLDWLVASPRRPRPRPDGHVAGAKPPEFCRWLFACMGARHSDEFVDLFPGTGAVAAEWDAWTAQLSLLESSA